jgi:hypothetical protein
MQQCKIGIILGPGKYLGSAIAIVPIHALLLTVFAQSELWLDIDAG